MNEHETAAADIAGLRISHCQRKCGRNAGVDCVATCAQDFCGYFSAEGIRHCDGSFREARWRIAAAGRDEQSK